VRGGNHPVSERISRHLVVVAVERRPAPRQPHMAGVIRQR